MKLSQSTFLYFNYPLREAIRRLSDLGYDGVEIWGGRPHAYCRDVSAAEASRIRGWLEELEIQVSAFIPAQFRYPTCLCSPEDGIRRDSVQYLKDSIDTSLSLGCRKVSVCPGHTLYGQGYENGMDRLQESLKELTDYAGEKEVLLFLEPAHRLESDLVITVEDGVRLVREIGAENLGLVMDTGHCFVNRESLPDCVALMQGIPYHIHIDDNTGLSDDHLVPGDGRICFVPFLKALKNHAYEGFLTAELGWGYTAEPDAAAYRCKVFMDSLLGGI